mgnify:CR=1 FL=1
MLSSKAMGWSLTMGFVTLVILMGASMIEGNHETRAEQVAWLAANKDWQWLFPIEMVGGLTMLIFTAGMISWIRSIDESNPALTYASYLPLLALVVSWVGFISGGSGAQAAEKNADAAYALMQLSSMSGFLGVVMMMLSFFLVGTTAYLKKSGTPALMGLLGILGLAGVVMSFIPGMGFLVFMAIFPLSLLLVAFIGIQKARA